MNNFFRNKNKFLLLVGLILASSINAMYQLPEQFMQIPFTGNFVEEWDQTVRANQELSQQNNMLQQMIVQANLDSLVADAKKFPKKADGTFCEAAKKCLQEAAASGHPEAAFLLEDRQASRACQEWRMSEALLYLKNLKSCNVGMPLNVESEAYRRFIEIINHPESEIAQDWDIRHQAYRFLGHMYDTDLGVPCDPANRQKAQYCFAKATELEQPQKASDKTEQPQKKSDKTEQPQMVSPKPQEQPQPAPEKSPNTQIQLPKQEQKITQQPIKPIDEHKMVVKLTFNVPSQPEIKQETPKIVAVPQKPAEVTKEEAPGKFEMAPAHDNSSVQPAGAIQKPDDAEAKVIVLLEDIQKAQDADAHKSQQTSLPVEMEAAKSTADKKAAANYQKEDGKQKVAPKPTKKIVQKSEPEPIKPTFVIEEDPESQVQKNLAPDVHESLSSKDLSKIVLKRKQDVAKVQTQLSRKAKKIKKEQDKKEQSQKVEREIKEEDKAELAETHEEKELREPKKKKKTEKPHKDNENEQPKTEQETSDTALQAFKRVIDLVKYYINDKAVAFAIRSDLGAESDEKNWTSAIATYKGAYHFISQNYKKESLNHPTLMGILNYLKKNFQEANKLVDSKKRDAVTDWYQALIFLRTKEESHERNITVKDLLDSTLSCPLADLQAIMSLLYVDDAVINFVTTMAMQNGNSSNDRSRWLRLKLILNEHAGKDIVQELKTEHNQGSVEAMLLLARMYIEGVFIEKSYQNALSILQESVKSDKNFHTDRAELLRIITADSQDKKDYLLMVHANFLNILEACKALTNELNILVLLKAVEDRLQDIINDRTLSDELRTKIGNLLWETGTYKTLLPIAEKLAQEQKNEEIALEFYNVILQTDTLIQSTGPDKKYTKATELAGSIQRKRTERAHAYSLVLNLITKYFDKTQAKELDSASKKLEMEFQKCHTAEDVYKASYKILKDNIGTVDEAFLELMAILLYLQNNFKEASETINRCPDKGTMLSSWYRALIMLSAQPESVGRDSLILTHLTHALTISIDGYKFLKNLYYLDNKIVTFLKEKLSADQNAGPLLARMAIMFGCDAIGTDHETALNIILRCHENDKTGMPTLLLAELNTYGILVPQSLPNALAFLEQIISNKKFEISVEPLLQEIYTIAKRTNDIYSTIYAHLLIILDANKKSNEEQLRKALDTLHDLFEIMAKTDGHGRSPENLNKAANLLKATGAYTVLLSAAKKDRSIALKLKRVVRNIIKFCGHPHEQYKEALELATGESLPQADQADVDQFTILETIKARKKEEYAKACSIVGMLIEHYIHEEPQEIMKIVSTISHNYQGDYNQDAHTVYKNAHDFFAAEFEHDTIACPEFLEMLNYLQGYLPDGNKINISDPELHFLFANWHQMLLVFATNATIKPELNEKIITILKNALYVPITKYEKIKKRLIADKEFINHLKKLAATSDVAKLVVARITLLFGTEITEIDVQTAKNYLYHAHSNGLFNASMGLAEMYAFGIEVTKSLPYALKIMQKAVTLLDNADEKCIRFLKTIRDMAKDKKDFLSFLHAQYLLIIEQTKTKFINSNDYHALKEYLEVVEKDFETIPDDQKTEAAHLLHQSGAYHAIINKAKENTQVACEVMVEVQKRIFTYHHNAEDYKEVVELAKNITRNNSELENSTVKDVASQCIPVLELCFRQGSMEAGIRLARLYVFGYGVKQSIPQALEILKTIIEKSDQFTKLDDEINDLLNKIVELVTNNNGDITLGIYALCLRIVQLARVNSTIVQLVNTYTTKTNLETYERILDAIKLNANQSNRHAVAEIFRSSGASDALQPIAQQNPQIQARIDEIVSETAE